VPTPDDLERWRGQIEQKLAELDRQQTRLWEHSESERGRYLDQDTYTARHDSLLDRIGQLETTQQRFVRADVFINRQDETVHRFEALERRITEAESEQSATRRLVTAAFTGATIIVAIIAVVVQLVK
jgi:hypothetical protein